MCYRIVGYSIDFYFHDCKPTLEIDENGHSDRTIDYRTIDVLKVTAEIFRCIKQLSSQLTKKGLIDRM